MTKLVSIENDRNRSSSRGLIFIEEDGTIQYMNSVMQSYLGYTGKNLQKSHISSVIPPRISMD